MLVTISFRLDNGGVIPLKDLVSKRIHIGLMCVILFPRNFDTMRVPSFLFLDVLAQSSSSDSSDERINIEFN